jgi:hypothetical protein
MVRLALAIVRSKDLRLALRAAVIEGKRPFLVAYPYGKRPWHLELQEHWDGSR